MRNLIMRNYLKEGVWRPIVMNGSREQFGSNDLCKYAVIELCLWIFFSGIQYHSSSILYMLYGGGKCNSRGFLPDVSTNKW
jgi:hypothetical protein